MTRDLADIDADLATAYASRRAALAQEEYTFNSGQGSQSVKRNLAEINKTIRALEAERRDAESSGAPVFIDFQRGGT